MNIQSNINQTFSLIGLLASQSPAAAARREEVVKRRKLKGIEKQQALIGEGTQEFGKQFVEKVQEFDSATDDDSKIAKGKEASKIASQLSEYTEAGLSLAQEAFDLDPTFENFQAIKHEEARIKGFSNISSAVAKSTEGFEEAKARLEEAKAQQALAAEQKRVSKKRNFLDYIGDEPISLGGQPFGTVRDIGSDVSKKAIKQAYTKKEKTDIMNRKDEENG